MILILAEKPSVARDIARVVGSNRAKSGYIEGSTYTVTWAIGHLVTLPAPHEIKPEWKTWKAETLPMLPESWPLQVIEQTRIQFSVIKKLMKDCESVICATDAGREGELIFQYIYEAARCRKPVKRLWISSLTPDAIQEGMRNLKEGSLYQGLADAARARSCADWLIGMNLSRSYALAYGEKFFVGRVQTPTLAMVAKRDLEIKNFKSEPYFELFARFGCSIEGQEAVFEGRYCGEYEKAGQKNPEVKRLHGDGVLAKQIQKRIEGGVCQLKAIDAKIEKQSPPQLYDLTELQRHANRLYGLSASQTLEAAQGLYEKHKLLSYPRTDSRFLSKSVANTLPKILDAIKKPYEGEILPSTGSHLLDSRFVNDSEVSDHHAIIPTPISRGSLPLSVEEAKIYDLVCRRLLSAYQKDHVTSITTLWTQVESKESVRTYMDLFRTQGVQVQEWGWKRVERRITNDESGAESLIPTGLDMKSKISLRETRLDAKKTKAPPSLTEATLLTAMESAGKTLEDRELSTALKDSGLGTPATRAGIIETLLSRGYMERKGKFLHATALGLQLIETVHPSVKSPELTAHWEKELTQIQKKQRTLQGFLDGLSQELRSRVTEIHTSSLKSLQQDVLMPANSQKNRISTEILSHLIKGPIAAGRLFQELTRIIPGIERRQFESILLGLDLLKKIQIQEVQFEKDGKQITYRKVALQGSQKSQTGEVCLESIPVPTVKVQRTTSMKL